MGQNTDSTLHTGQPTVIIVLTIINFSEKSSICGKLPPSFPDVTVIVLGVIPLSWPKKVLKALILSRSNSVCNQQHPYHVLGIWSEVRSTLISWFLFRFQIYFQRIIRVS